MFGPLVQCAGLSAVTIYLCYNLFPYLVGKLSIFRVLGSWPKLRCFCHINLASCELTFPSLPNLQNLIMHRNFFQPLLGSGENKAEITCTSPVLVQQERCRRTRWKSEHLRLSCSSRSLLNLTCSSASCFFTFSFRATARKLCDGKNSNKLWSPDM